MDLKIVIAGPRGKMGSEVGNMVNNESKFKVVAYIDYKPSKFTQASNSIPVFTDGDSCFNQITADILIDFTVPDACFQNAKAAIHKGVYSVIGTTGMSQEQINELKRLSNQKQIGCIVAPNFAIGAVLMMEFAKQAARYFPNVEIIDKHHEFKNDSPSGTAIKTAQLIQQTNKQSSYSNPKEYETIQSARGAVYDGINIHSIRLPGYVAHHEVIFGAPGQTLSIKHDSINRESFMDGLKLAIEHVKNSKSLTYGLENLIDMY